jgi:hypothetical protein
LGEAIGIEYPDTYKRYKLEADAILEDAKEFIRANQIDAVRARNAVRRSFTSAAGSDQGPA